MKIDERTVLPSLNDNEFNRLSEFIQTNYGIKLPQGKRIVLQGRLQKRLKVLSMNDFKTYVDYVFSVEGQGEIVNMIDVVSTNKTDFFRESAHFDYLSNTILPELLNGNRYKTVRVWSAGCSSGEEPYTLAMVINEFKEKNPGMEYNILATDISTQMLQKGVDAVYRLDHTVDIPLYLKKKYLLRSKDPSLGQVRIVKELRDKVQFRRVNFMDSVYQVENEFDIIFCRNALIYFERPVQEAIINKLCQHLVKGGYFVLGHSETITNMNVPLERVASTISRKKA